MGRVREKRRVEERRSEKRNSQKEDAGARKGRKVAKHYVFPMICGSGGSKSRLAKAAGGPELVFCTFWLRNVLRATPPCTFSTSQLPKVVRSWCVLYLLASKCASRHNGVHFFDISTSKSGPRMVCFVHFAFEMRFAQQRRAIFHLSSGQMAPHFWKLR